MDSCKCCKKEEDGMGGGVNRKICLRFFFYIYTTKKNLPYRTELSVGLECVKKSLKNFHTIHAFSFSFAFFYGKAIKLFYSSNSRLNEIYFFLVFSCLNDKYIYTRMIIKALHTPYQLEQAVICDMKA